jgi:hypothetical protein
MIDSVRDGEPVDDVKKRLGKPARERQWTRTGASGNAPGTLGRPLT